jgi:hypothetical protein
MTNIVVHKPIDCGREMYIEAQGGPHQRRFLWWTMRKGIGGQGLTFAIAALASRVVASMAIICPWIKPSSPSTRTNHRNAALCVSTGNSRRVREIVEWSGVASVTLKPTNSRSDNLLSHGWCGYTFGKSAYISSPVAPLWPYFGQVTEVVR